MPVPDASLLTEERIRPARLMADKQGCVEADREFLTARRSEWQTVACPACAHPESRLFGEKHGFVYVECRECGTVYTNPRPSVQLLREFYATSQNYAYWNQYIFPATEDARRERIFRPRARRLAEYARRFGLSGGTLLEVGAAFGTFCEEIRRENLFEKIIAVEPTPELAQTCRQRGFDVRETFVEDLPDTIAADVIAAFEVLEHLHNPREFIEHCRRLLGSAGLLVVTCPNIRGFDVSTLGMLSNTFDHEHLNYFYPESLAGLMQRCGFEVVDLQTPGELDVDLVRKQIVCGAYRVDDQPFLRQVLLDRADELGGPFQRFLAENRLSSHMWAVARCR
jgi:2-polyprenyl-3-methyl-5-hydroxy-6-metoxy-1,4-benzoquinol methylase/ribosomal protein S27E